MELPFSVNTFGALVTASLGAVGLLAPSRVGDFLGLAPDGPKGLAEIRATFGGLFLALGLAAALLQEPSTFRFLGLGWFGIAGGRAFAVVKDESRSAATLGATVFEVLLGLALFVPWGAFSGT